MKIGSNPGISQRDFNEIVHLNHSSITRAVNQLIKKGLVKKTTNPKDKRAAQLFLTTGGERVNNVVEREINQLNSDLMSRLGDNQQHFYDDVVALRESIEEDD